MTFLDILDLFPSIPTPPSLVLQNIKSLDRLPFALDDQYQAISGKSLSVSTWNSVLSNDRSSAIHREVHVIDKPVNGALALHSDGSFVYKSVLGYQGLDFFTYQIFDGKNYSNIATVGIDVKSNIPPIKIIAQNQSYVIKANQVLSVDAPGLMKGAIAPPGTVLSAGLDSIPTWGSVTFFPGDGSFVYYPSPDFVGTDSFRYDISAPDPNNGTITSTGLVTIHVKS